MYDSIVQKYHNIPITVFFQPHTYSRTLALSTSFITTLSFFDEVYIFPTFSSCREQTENKLQVQVNHIFSSFKCVESMEEVKIKKEKRIYVFLGAGEVFKNIPKLKKMFDENK